MFDESRERWHLFRPDRHDIDQIRDEFALSEVNAKTLLARGLGKDKDELRDFLNPPFEFITCTEGLADEHEVTRAVDRIIKAIQSKEHVVVNGDPDADGITAATIVVAVVRYLGGQIDYDFPTRSREGHGLQPRILDEAKSKGATLVITTDCGSKDIPAADYARQLGIDVIICDHHVLGKVRPTVHALVNPYTVKGPSSYKYLAGAGVALKMMLAVVEKMDKQLTGEYLDYLVALATLGTISDRMSFLSPMNRALVNEGMRGINDTRMEGLKALKDISSKGIADLMARDVSRTIVPRLNAPGRIGNREEGIPDSRIVVDLLLLGIGKQNAKKASSIVEKFADVFEMDQSIKRSSHGVQEAAMVDDVNEQRKYITSRIEDEIEEYLESGVDVSNDRVVIVRGKDWNPGVIGIDTDRLRERFLRPAMVLTEYSGEAFLRGSVRSIPKINMYNALDKVGDLFYELHGRILYQTEVQTELGPQRVNAFGGHAQACGFSIHRDDVAEFIQLLREEMNRLPVEDFEFSYDIVDTIRFDHVTPELVDDLQRLTPYGQYFDYPLFYLKNVNISQIRAFGNRYQRNRTPHMDFFVSDATKRNKNRINAVGFGLLDKYNLLKQQHDHDPMLAFDVICNVEMHRRVRRGRKPMTEFRLNVVDIRIAGQKNLD